MKFKGRTLEEWEKTVTFEEVEELLEEGEIIPFREVKYYLGTFTGKMVKPNPEDQRVSLQG